MCKRFAKARAERFELPTTVLETGMIPFHHARVRLSTVQDSNLRNRGCSSAPISTRPTVRMLKNSIVFCGEVRCRSPIGSSPIQLFSRQCHGPPWLLLHCMYKKKRSGITGPSRLCLCIHILLGPMVFWILFAFY